MTSPYSPLNVLDMQRIASQVLRLVLGQEVALTTSDASESVPAGAIGALLYCDSSNFYWQLDAAAVAGDGGGALATAGTWFNIALHPDVSTIHAILASGTATLQINFLFG